MTNQRFKTTEQRFWEKVHVAGKNECWEWLAAKDGRGYGAFRSKNKVRIAHRVVWELVNGEIPNRMRICHKCDNRICVNPDHLFLGTSAQNSIDMVMKCRQRHQKLTPRQARHVLLSGKPTRELAQMYGVTTGCIDNIKHGVTWKHLSDSNTGTSK